MPFDGTMTEALTGRALYQDRRKRAAALWRSVPSERFDMREWECGTTACALGWLARVGVDGWSFKLLRVRPVPIWADSSTSSRSAANYFDVSLLNSFLLFGLRSATCRTASEVADELLALPYAVAPVAEAPQLAEAAD